MNLQLLFIADLKHKRVKTESPDRKPGRQIVTYLLVCNLGLWITNNFEIQKVNLEMSVDTVCNNMPKNVA